MSEAEKFPKNPIIVVDDERAMVQICCRYLAANGLNNVVPCSDGRQVLGLIKELDPDVLLLDLVMPHLRGDVLLPKIVEEYPNLPVIIITGTIDVTKVVECMKAGARDYLEKPVRERELIAAVRQALEVRQLRLENERLRQSFFSPGPEDISAFSSFVTGDRAVLRIFQYVEAVASSSNSVLVTGETGVGKELVARTLHDLSQRRGKFVTVNVAGLDDDVFSDTLFGHRKGAYTGAEGERLGLIAQAEGGTLFLDEIGHLGVNSQVKLLRFLQENEYLPLGEDLPVGANVRIVAATNVALERLQEEKSFRQDLFYRLCTHHVHIPPLRERPLDIPLLLDHFLATHCPKMGLALPAYPKELILLLSTYSFPGNVRELEAMVLDALCNHKKGMLSMKRFKEAMKRKQDEAIRLSESIRSSEVENSPGSVFLDGNVGIGPEGGSLPTLKVAEELLIKEALRRTKGNQTLAAQMLGLSRQALNKRLKRSEKLS